LDHEITDMTWTGNELNIKFLKKLLSFFSFFMRTNKLLKFLKNQKNNKIISKYFD
jgi:hypothetical protein